MDIKKLAFEYYEKFYPGGMDGRVAVGDMIDFANRIQRMTIEECVQACRDHWDGTNPTHLDANIEAMRKLRK